MKGLEPRHPAATEDYRQTRASSLNADKTATYLDRLRGHDPVTAEQLRVREWA